MFLSSVLVSDSPCRDGERPENISRYKYLARKERRNISDDQFPTSLPAIRNYQSKFSDEPTAAQLFENIDMNTTESRFQIDLLNNIISPHRIEEVILIMSRTLMECAPATSAVYFHRFCQGRSIRPCSFLWAFQLSMSCRMIHWLGLMLQRVQKQHKNALMPSEPFQPLEISQLLF